MFHLIFYLKRRLERDTITIRNKYLINFLKEVIAWSLFSIHNAIKWEVLTELEKKRKTMSKILSRGYLK